VLEWLRHRDARAKERVEKGLPARNPTPAPLLSAVRSGDSFKQGASSQPAGGAPLSAAGAVLFGRGGGSVRSCGSGARSFNRAVAEGGETKDDDVNDDAVSVLSDADGDYSTAEQAAAAGRQRAAEARAQQRPLPRGLCAVTSAAWGLAVPKRGASAAHLHALSELCAFNPSPPPKPPLRADGSYASGAGANGSLAKKGRQQLPFAAGSRAAASGGGGGGAGTLPLPSSHAAAPFEPLHLVGVAGPSKPLHAAANLAWVDVRRAASTARPDWLDPYLGWGGRGGGCAAERRDVAANGKRDARRAAARVAKRAAVDAARAAVTPLFFRTKAAKSAAATLFVLRL
jgi:hypothetical protein